MDLIFIYCEMKKVKRGFYQVNYYRIYPDGERFQPYEVVNKFYKMLETTIKNDQIIGFGVIDDGSIKTPLKLLLNNKIMKLAIAILNWNGKHWLKRFLPNVIKHSQGADIWVIDNASTDDSVVFLERNFPEVKVVKNLKNNGFAGGYNEGLKAIKADIFCLLNSDVEVSSGWLEPVLALFKSDENIVAVQPKILDFNNEKYFEFAGAGGGMIDNLGYPYCRGRVFDTLEKDEGQYDDVCEIHWASGCCLFIRSESFLV